MEKSHVFGLNAFLFSVVFAPACALAHSGGGVSGGLVSGFTHPILGFDHLLAMLAVGVWGAQIGGRSVWQLPVTFPLIMAIGGFLGLYGVPITHVEVAIGLSVVILGLAILAAWKAPEWISLLLVGFFAIFHGIAHGAELPEAADPMAYAAGFVTATGLIHIVGILFGLVFTKPFDGWIARATGGLIACAGLYFLFG